jgi:hypothetical protein
LCFAQERERTGSVVDLGRPTRHVRGAGHPGLGALVAHASREHRQSRRHRCLSAKVRGQVQRDGDRERQREAPAFCTGKRGPDRASRDRGRRPGEHRPVAPAGSRSAGAPRRSRCRPLMRVHLERIAPAVLQRSYAHLVYRPACRSWRRRLSAGVWRGRIRSAVWRWASGRRALRSSAAYRPRGVPTVPCGGPRPAGSRPIAACAETQRYRASGQGRPGLSPTRPRPSCGRRCWLL